MKACGVCGRLYADDSRFCQADGQELISVSEAPVADDSDPRIGQLLANRYLIYRFVADGGGSTKGWIDMLSDMSR